MRSAIVFALAAVLFVPTAAAHHAGATSDVVPVLDTSPRALARVTVQLTYTLGWQLVVENRTGKTLEVLDESGRAFVRIGRHEPTTAWGWFDPRIRPDRVDVARGVLRAGVRTTVGRWAIPMRLNGKALALTGRFETLPAPDGAFRARLTSGDPFDGVSVTLMPGRVPALYLVNASDDDVLVLGSDGEPFLRIGPDGTRANLHSATWRRMGKVTAAADDGMEPRWALQSPSPRYAWIEPRAAAPASWTDDAPAREWSVALRRGADEARVIGVVEWVPSASGVQGVRLTRSGD
jgi:hypothetical protein